MCTDIARQAQLDGSGKGTDGWFQLSRVCIGYDHPTSTPAEHAVLLDFHAADDTRGRRLAVELTRESAHRVVHELRAALALADAYEGATRAGQPEPTDDEPATQAPPKGPLP